LTIPASAFGMSYLRAYYGETTAICGIPIDATVGLLFGGLAALFGFSASKGAQTAATFLRDIANGALASWTASFGADFGAKKRLERPVPTPQPNTGVEETPERAPRPITPEELAAIRAATGLKAKPAMAERPRAPPVHAPPPAAPVAQSAVAASAKSETAPAMPSTPQKPSRFTPKWVLDPEAEMRRLLQSAGAPSDPNTVTHLLTHENPGEELKAIVQRARATA